MTTRTTIPDRDVPAGPIPNRRNEVVLDGDTAYTTDTPISDALADATEDSVITVGPGTYEENVLVTTASVTIVGAGRASVIDGGTAGPAVDIRANNVVLRDIGVQTTGGGGSNADGVILQNGITSPRMDGVYVLDADRDGIHINNADRAQVYDCTFEKTDEKAVLVEAASVTAVVQNNLFRQSVGGDAIQVRADNALVSDNTIDLPGRYGVWTQSTATGVRIVDNTILNALDHGIRVTGDENVVTGNSVRDGSSKGIVVNAGSDGTTVTDNDVVNNDGGNYDLSGTNIRETYKGNDIDSDGDGTVDAADSATNVTSTYKGNDIDSDGDGTVDNSDQLEGQSKAEILVDSPNGHIINVALENGETAEITIPVADQETLTVYRWGAYQVTDFTAPAGLEVELLDGSDTVQANENTTDTENTAGVASHQNTSGSKSLFKLRVNNGTGGAINDPGAGAFFAYEVA